MADSFDVEPVDEFNLRGNGTMFDFSAVSGRDERLRMMSSVRLLYKDAARYPARMRIITGVNSRSGRVVRFFDTAAGALAGTRSPPPIAAAGGFSIWRGAGFLGRINNQGTAIEDRTDERICILPSSFASYSGVVMATWHEMSHIFTTLNHLSFDAASGQYQPPDDPINKAWMAHIDALRVSAPETDIDPADNGRSLVRSGTSWVCNCGTHSTRLSEAG